MRFRTMPRVLAAASWLCWAGGSRFLYGQALPGPGLNDEFDAAKLSSAWSVGFRGGSVIKTSAVPGHLTIIPAQSAWYEDGTAPIVFKKVRGNFVVETHVNAHLIGAPAKAASGPYMSGGFVIRDPRSAPGAQNWIMYNTGHQGAPFSMVGTERKDTVQSRSSLDVRPGLHSGRLRVCRLGHDFHLFRWLDDETGWSAEPASPEPSNPIVRDDFPDQVEVGLVANAYQPPIDVQVDFDYVRFGGASSLDDCTAALRNKKRAEPASSGKAAKVPP